jgi:hypothetical protein
MLLGFGVSLAVPAEDVRVRRIGGLLSRARRRDCRFQADNLGGQPQFHLLWWQALGRILAEEGPGELVCQSGIIVSSHNHTRLETQMRYQKAALPLRLRRESQGP